MDYVGGDIVFGLLTETAAYKESIILGPGASILYLRHDFTHHFMFSKADHAFARFFSRLGTGPYTTLASLPAYTACFFLESVILQ